MATTKATKSTKATEPVAAPAAAPATHPSNGLGIAALVVGIFAFVFGWVIFLGFLAGAAAIVLGVIALKKPGQKGLPIAGIITGAVGALISLIVTLFFFLALAAITTTGVTAGGALNGVNKALDQYNAENKALIQAPKDFKKGETAKFAEFEVKANSVQRDYLPTDTYSQPEAGKEFIVVNVTVKNTANELKSISNYDLKLNEAGVANTVSYVTVDPVFYGGELSPGASLTGNIVYQVMKGASDLKLQYSTYVYDLNGSGLQNLTFTLAL